MRQRAVEWSAWTFPGFASRQVCRKSRLKSLAARTRPDAACGSARSACGYGGRWRLRRRVRYGHLHAWHGSRRAGGHGRWHGAVIFHPRGVRGERAVLVHAHARLLLQERDHRPDLLVVMGFAPGWHRGELDAVLDDPECLRGPGRETRQVRRLGIQAIAQFGVAESGCQMATGAHL